MPRAFPTLALLGTALLLAACADGREWPERGFLLAGDEAVPVSCLAGYGRSDGALPLGCANELNLTRMVERRSDLVSPRQAGPAFADPVAAAAESYLGLLDEQPGAGGTATEAPAVERVATGAMPETSSAVPPAR